MLDDMVAPQELRPFSRILLRSIYPLNRFV
jgi:hypothetical protein